MNAATIELAGSASYFLCTVGYTGLAALLIIQRSKGTLAAAIVLIASLVTGCWAAATSFDLLYGNTLGLIAVSFEVLRSLTWILVLLSLLSWMPPRQRSSWAVFLVGLSFCLIALDTLSINRLLLDGGEWLPTILWGGRLLLALCGLGLVENLYRNSPPSRRWRIKYLCFGTGSFFAYDFFLYANATLVHQLNADLFAARGVTSLLAVPLLVTYALRDRTAGPEISVSHRFVLHTTTFIGAGLYLLLMGAVGYYVREFGGTWSGFFEAIFFFAAAILLIIPLSSGSARAYLRVLIEKTFFAYKYDYRAEWLRFIRTLSSTNTGEPLQRRVIQAVGDIVDSPDGGLWSLRERTYELNASWNASRWNLQPADSAIPVECPLVQFLEKTHWILDLDEVREHPERLPELGELPHWLGASLGIWLLVPLIRHDRLFGLILLGKARARRDLTWEDFDILKTIGQEAASYLAEQRISETLMETEQFDAFNKRFAFVVHDIKNLASQLSLLLENAEKYRGNARFQSDMLDTVKSSVSQMNRMLKQLHAQPQQAMRVQRVVLSSLVRQVANAQDQMRLRISVEPASEKIAVNADGDRLKAVIEHLVQNAIEAIPPNGTVRLKLTHDQGMAVVEVEDNGPGMEAEFINERLFRPFASTKSGGYGIGAYETREFARSLGGGLEVSSRVGIGTKMRLKIPAVLPV